MRSFNRLLGAVLAVSLLSCQTIVSATQIEPEQATKFAEWKRTNHIKISNLQFCPDWFGATRTGTDCRVFGHVVLQVSEAGDAKLNPKLAEAPWLSLGVIDIASISKDIASRKLGGKDRGGNVLTCDLISDYGEEESNVYHLDLRFEKERVVALRIRGCDITSPKWVDISGKSLAQCQNIWQDLRFSYDDRCWRPKARAPEPSALQKLWIEGRPVATPSVPAGCRVEVTAFERVGGKEFGLRPLPFVDASEKGWMRLARDGTATFAIMPVDGELKDLTTARAHELFGMATMEGLKNDISVATYQFAGVSGVNGQELEIVRLDCEFGNGGKLSRYRLRSDCLPKANWILVK